MNLRRSWPVVAVATLVLLAVVTAPALAEPPKFTFRDWMKLTQDTKLQVIHGVIEMAKQNQITISLSPDYYVGALDSLARTYVDTKNDRALGSPMGIAFHTVAAMEGDWGNGENKLQHAKTWLGDWFDYFKKHYPEKYQHLLEDDKK
jgi:hypothetical protein